MVFSGERKVKLSRIDYFTRSFRYLAFSRATARERRESTELQVLRLSRSPFETLRAAFAYAWEKTFSDGFSNS